MKIQLPNLALFSQTLTMDNRHWNNYLFRLLLLAVILCTLVIFMLSSTFSPFATSAMGLKFFTAIAHINIVFITFLGIAMFSSAITEEKEANSLSLLLMTGLTPFSMLLSKSTSKLIMGLILILVQFPFTLLSITLGGISLYQIFAAYLTLLSYTILICNVALFFSVISRRTATAAGLCMLTMLSFHIWLPIWPASRWLSPFFRTQEILSTGFRGPAWSLQVTFSILIGIVFFLLSLSLFNHFSRKASLSSPIRIPWSMRKSKWKTFPVKRAWNNAIAWKSFHFQTGGKFAIFSISSLLILILLITCYLNYQWRNNYENVGSFVLTIGLTTLFIEGLYISASLFSDEILEKTLSTLLMLPYSLQSIAFRKILGASIITIPALIFIFIGFILSMPDMINKMAHIDFWTGIFTALLYVLFYYYLTVYFSIHMKYGAFIVAGIVLWLLSAIISIPIMLLAKLFRLFSFIEYIDFISLLIMITYHVLGICLVHYMIGRKIKSIV